MEARPVDGFVGRGVWGWVRGEYAISVGRMSAGDFLVVLFQRTNFVTQRQVTEAPRNFDEAARLVFSEAA